MDGIAAVVPTSEDLPDVTLYTANVRPFCPIVRRRLKDLQERGGFSIREVDVTFRPDVIRSRGLRSVPILEANGRLLVGNTTSAEIAAILESSKQLQ